MFQGNPQRFPILNHLKADERLLNWSIARHFNDLNASDNAGLWVSGRNAGVYAIGHVTGSPYEENASDDWINPDDRGRSIVV